MLFVLGYVAGLCSTLVVVLLYGYLDVRRAYLAAVEHREEDDK